MPTFEFTSPGGQKFSVDGPEGATPEQAFQVLQQRMGGQAAPAAAPDKYQAAAQQELASDKAKGIPLPSAIQRRLLQGATFNFADELLAGAATPIEMIKRGTLSPIEGYNYAKARADANLEDARKESGALGTAAEIGGGVLSGLGLARGGVGLMSRLAPEAGLGARSLASAADAAAYGTVAGAGEGNGIAERAKHAAIGGTGGLVLGGAAPAAFSAAGSALSPVVSNIAARINPAGYAQRQLARALQESGQSPQQIADSVSGAAAEGQPMFTVADAMGNSGQRMLSTVTKAPGEGRTSAVNFLDARQAGQGRRVANILSEGFDAPETSTQTQARLTTQRTTEANRNYGAARDQSGAVNVTPAIEAADNFLAPGVSRIMNPQTNIADNSIEGAVRRARSYLTDGHSQIADFDAALYAKQEIDHLIETGSRAQQRVLIPIRNALDEQMAAVSKPYAAARDRFAQQSRTIEAVDTGRQAATRGRVENTVPAFRSMPADQQAAFRSGYVDPLIEQTQGAAVGVNKARPFTSDAFATESQAVAPLRTGNTMTRRLGRENTMFATRNEALGNSKTAENLADANAMGIDPSIVGKILHGNWAGAARSLLSSASNAASGNTAAVRQEVGRLLMMRGGNVTPQQLQDLLSQAIQMAQVRQTVANRGITGLAAGAALAPSANSRP